MFACSPLGEKTVQRTVLREAREKRVPYVRRHQPRRRERSVRHGVPNKIRFRKKADFCLYYSLFIIHHSLFIYLKRILNE